MPISYTKRGWTNNSPPAINAANLGAMDDALKLTADKVDTIAEGADVTATALASAIEGGTPTTTPDDTDKLPGVKSDHSLLYYTWASVKTALWTAWGSLINSGTTKATPIDADAIALMDSAASNATKKLTWANLVATIKTALGITYTSGTLTVNGSASTANIPTAAPTATPTASRVPIADTNAELNTWINSASLLTKLKSAPKHISRYAECASLTPDKFMVFKVAAGRFNFSWNYATGRRWFFPPGTVVYGTTTPILTSTDQQPDVTIPSNGGYVVLISGTWTGNYQLNGGSTTTSLKMALSDLPALTYSLILSYCSLVTGSLSDLPALTYSLSLYNCPLVTGSLSDLPALTYYLDLSNCPLVTGSLPVPTTSTFRAYLIYLSGCTGIQVANSIVNMATYWNGKTAPTGAVLNMGTLRAEYDVTAEVSQLVAAGFTVTYTPY